MRDTFFIQLPNSENVKDIKLYTLQTSQKKAGVAMLLSDNIYFKRKIVLKTNAFYHDKSVILNYKN